MEETYMKPKLKPKEKPHYVNNKQFSHAVVDYVKSVTDAEAKGLEPPKVTDYIATCFMKISEGLSHRPNFVRYTYRDEMVMDAVENCLRAIRNYKIETATRTGNPNAFSYFTQICFFAFIRRITKEKKQQDIKHRFIERMGIEEFMDMGMDQQAASDTQAYVDTLKGRIDTIKVRDKAVKEFAKEEKAKAKKLELFMV
jgi:hypothetical protein|tara:strand:+ start:81 stop:674 length:594 start_codon:yes stop_codon:yes gene_type:complete